MMYREKVAHEVRVVSYLSLVALAGTFGRLLASFVARRLYTCQYVALLASVQIKGFKTDVQPLLNII